MCAMRSASPLPGDFRQGGSPTPEQLAAGGALLDWLLLRYPQLNLQTVKGLSEYIDTLSPGREWMEGANWKQRLLAAMPRAMGVVEDTATVQILRAESARLEAELAELQSERTALEEERLDRTAEIQQLRKEVAAKPSGPMNFVVPAPPIQEIVEQLPKHTRLRYDRRPLQQITHIAIHHTAAPAALGRRASPNCTSPPIRRAARKRGRASAITTLSMTMAASNRPTRWRQPPITWCATTPIRWALSLRAAL